MPERGECAATYPNEGFVCALAADHHGPHVPDILADINDAALAAREAYRTRDRAAELQEIEACTDELLRRAGFEKIPREDGR